jgi:hypothetical protein
MFRTGALKPWHTTSGSWAWTRDGEHVASVAYRANLVDGFGTLTLEYTQGTGDERKAVTCRIELESLPCHYGGRRWFARCPYTHRRAWKLYKWARIEWFCHRDAIRPRPTYATQRRGGSDRIIEQRWALRRKLGDDFSDLFGEPVKPKWMHWQTFERYAARDAALANREWAYMARILGGLGEG